MRSSPRPLLAPFPALLPLLLLLLLSTGLAGCLQTDVTVTVEGPEPRTWTLYFDADGRLVPDAPAPGAVPLGWSHPQWALGDAPPRWTDGGMDGLVVLQATAYTTFRAREAATTTGIRPDLSIWWGGDGLVAHTTVEGPPAWLPGAEVSATMELEVPVGGLWLSPGEAMTALVATYTTDAPEADRVELVVGGPPEAASRIDLVGYVPVFPDWTYGAEAASWSGVHGGDCTGGTNQVLEHELSPVPDAFEVELTASGAGVQDLDVYVVSPDGPLMRAHGPGTHEVLRLLPPNLPDADALTLQVLGACAGRLDYALTVTELTVAGT